VERPEGQAGRLQDLRRRGAAGHAECSARATVYDADGYAAREDEAPAGGAHPTRRGIGRGAPRQAASFALSAWYRGDIAHAQRRTGDEGGLPPRAEREERNEQELRDAKQSGRVEALQSLPPVPPIPPGQQPTTAGVQRGNAFDAIGGRLGPSNPFRRA